MANEVLGEAVRKGEPMAGTWPYKLVSWSPTGDKATHHCTPREKDSKSQCHRG